MDKLLLSVSEGQHGGTHSPSCHLPPGPPDANPPSPLQARLPQVHSGPQSRTVLIGHVALGFPCSCLFDQVIEASPGPTGGQVATSGDSFYIRVNLVLEGQAEGRASGALQRHPARHRHPVPGQQLLARPCGPMAPRAPSMAPSPTTPGERCVLASHQSPGMCPGKGGDTT